MTPPLVLIFIPIICVPVPHLFPLAPVSIEVTVMYPVIPRRQEAVIIRGHIQDEPWDPTGIDVGPGAVVADGGEPVTSMEPVPEAIVEIKTPYARHHVDVGCFAGDDYYIRRLREFIRRRHADAYAHIHARISKRYAQDKKQRDYEKYDLLHKDIPPFG